MSQVASEISFGSQKITARDDIRLVTRSGDGYVAITLPRDEPDASRIAVIFCDPYHDFGYCSLPTIFPV